MDRFSHTGGKIKGGAFDVLVIPPYRAFFPQCKRLQPESSRPFYQTAGMKRAGSGIRRFCPSKELEIVEAGLSADFEGILFPPLITTGLRFLPLTLRINVYGP